MAQQLLEFGLLLIRSTCDFEKALGEWTCKAPRDKTSKNFKTHFTEAQAQLKYIRGPTMLQAGYHHANMLASQIRDDIANRNTEMLTMVENLADKPPALIE